MVFYSPLAVVRTYFVFLTPSFSLCYGPCLSAYVSEIWPWTQLVVLSPVLFQLAFLCLICIWHVQLHLREEPCLQSSSFGTSVSFILPCQVYIRGSASNSSSWFKKCRNKLREVRLLTQDHTANHWSKVVVQPKDVPCPTLAPYVGVGNPLAC